MALGAAALGSEIVSVSAHKELNNKCGVDRQSCPPPPGYDFHAARTRELVGFGLFLGLGTGGVLALGAAGVGLALPSRTQGPSTSLLISPTTIGVRSTF